MRITKICSYHKSNGSASLVELGSGIRGVSLILLVVWGFSACGGHKYEI